MILLSWISFSALLVKPKRDLNIACADTISRGTLIAIAMVPAIIVALLALGFVYCRRKKSHKKTKLKSEKILYLSLIFYSHTNTRAHTHTHFLRNNTISPMLQLMMISQIHSHCSLILRHSKKQQINFRAWTKLVKVDLVKFIRYAYLYLIFLVHF